MAAPTQSAGLILGIETSCDETAASVVRAGSDMLSNIVASQMETHAAFGGVVPELASREHLRRIVPVVRRAIADAGLTLRDLDAVAVTEGPGLAGALLVGISYAKSLACALGKPLIAVNHLEGHIHAVLLELRQQHAHTESPVLALVVSGGHTHLYLAHEEHGRWRYRNVGRTVDDAAGEAFDKVAKLLGLGYPGGPWLDSLAPQGTPGVVPFPIAQIKTKAHRPQTVDDGTQFFSFSGLKTAVLRHVEQYAMRPSIAARRLALDAIAHPTLADVLPLCDAPTLDLITGFQHTVVETLVRGTFTAAARHNVRALIVSGGVAANRELRARFTSEAAARSLTVSFPSAALATDNAAMIAAAAWPKFSAGVYASDELEATAQLRLG
jgi:N6-L-threonylcarbamoyladenine synthase